MAGWWWTYGCKSMVLRFRLGKQWSVSEVATILYWKCSSIQGNACVVDCWQSCAPTGCGSNRACTKKVVWLFAQSHHTQYIIYRHFMWQ
jgi:hypothetical protein